jgi:hypothetical protein
MTFTSILRQTLFFLVLASGIVASTYAGAQAQTDPLPSWNDGPTKKSITDFVARVTR